MMLSRLSRWQKSALLFCAGSLLSFVANLSFTIWAITRPGSNIHNGVGLLSEETSCSRVKAMNTGIHVLINVLSTILLAGSNYCMQCLSAPTREQIDEAHRKSTWVDVGVPSIRNLFCAVSGRNVVLWVLLSLSSLPLHLFYNSAIFTSISTNEYNVTIVNEGFIALQNLTTLPAYYGQSTNHHIETMHQALLDNRLEHLDLAACLEAYASNFQSARGDLLLVQPGSSIPPTPPDNFHLYSEATFTLANFGCGIRQAFEWMCRADFGWGALCTPPCEDIVPEYFESPGRWRPWGLEVKECWSLRTEERCKLLFSPTLCWIVTGLNLFKGVLMLMTALRLGRDGRPILTVGDAVASFMAVPDETTVDMCLVEKRDIVKSLGLWQRVPRTVGGRRRFKFAAASRLRWGFCIFMFMLAISACIGLYVFGVSHISGTKDLSSLLGLGLGTLSSKTFIQGGNLGSGWGYLVSNVVLANCPQVAMSMLYFLYNGLFTSISLATEWDSYARHRKGLRVSSSPVGAQRTAYFLQLPYRYSTPLVVISGLMHWLISQSIFLIFVEIYEASVENDSISGGTEGNASARVPVSDYTTCGWSPAGVFSVIVVGVVMVLFLLVAGSRRLGSDMPVAGSCSAAISAACHPMPYDKMASVEPLQWGFTSLEEDEKGHCSFSSGEVDAPRKGVLYS